MVNSKEVGWKRSLPVTMTNATIWSQSTALRGEADPGKLCYEQASLAAVASQTSLRGLFECAGNEKRFF